MACGVAEGWPRPPRVRAADARGARLRWDRMLGDARAERVIGHLSRSVLVRYCSRFPNLSGARQRLPTQFGTGGQSAADPRALKDDGGRMQDAPIMAGRHESGAADRVWRAPQRVALRRRTRIMAARHDRRTAHPFLMQEHGVRITRAGDDRMACRVSGARHTGEGVHAQGLPQHARR